MGERVTISYRGAAYELGRGRRYYGIWAAGEPRTEPVERWPETPEGWMAAWTRFTAIETPGTIAPAGQQQVQRQAPDQSPYGGPAGGQTGDPFAGSFAGGPMAGGPVAGGGPGAGGDTLAYGRQTTLSGRLALGSAGPAFAAALLALGVIFGLVGLFVNYQVGQTLAAQPPVLVPHVAFLAVWTVAAILIALRAGAVARAGALLAAGTSVITSGMLLSDLGAGFAAADAGLWLSIVGWLACTAGAALAVRVTIGKRALSPQTAGTAQGAGAAQGAGTAWPGTSAPDARGLGIRSLGIRGLGVRGLVRAALLIAASIGVALTFFPNWDSYLLRAAVSDQSETQGLGFAFAAALPGWVQFANVAIMVLFVLTVVVAALWRPMAAGAMLLIGAVIPMGAQAVSAIIQATEPTSPSTFGISAGQAQQFGLTITNSLTPAFWMYSLFVLVLAVSAVWMLISPPERPQAGSVPVPAAGPVTDSADGPVTDLADEPVMDSTGEPAQVNDPAPVTEPVTTPADSTWTERKLAADSWDDRA